MSDYPAELELAADERVADERDHAGGNALVSDGNSRWVIVRTVAYFVVNDKYEAPEE